MPAFQAPVTTPDDDNTISVTLPRELVERILLFLDTESTLICKLVSGEFNEIIQSSILLKYFLACKAAGVIDNPQSPLSYGERLEVLKKREDAWRKLKPVFEMTISVNNQAVSMIRRSIEGVYFLSDDNQKDLKYCRLTSFPQDNPHWIRFPGHGPVLDWSGILVDSVVALYEHDLIVNFISSEVGNQAGIQWHSLDLVLLKFSTGEYHPLARRPRIHVQISPRVDPRVYSKIVGDHLALVVYSINGTFSDKLFIFDWKTGRRLLKHKASVNAYSGLVFVSPELLLVPNRVLSHFEVWHLPPHQLHTQSPIQILSFRIPAVSPEYFVLDCGCYGEPNPFLHTMPYLPPRPFLSSPEDSIIMFTLGIVSHMNRDGLYNLIMHRRALLDTIQKWTSHSLLEQQEELPTWLTNEVTVHKIPNPEGGSDELDAQSKLVSMMPHPRCSTQIGGFATLSTARNLPTSHISTDSGSSSVSSELSTNSSTSRYTFPEVPWAEWGPPISRWFQVNDPHARWISHSNGQRFAFSEPNPLDRRKLMISVADFNPQILRRNAQTMARLRSREFENTSNNSNDKEGKEEEEEFEILDHKGVFSEEVYMGLKCVVYRVPDEYDFDLVLMDEERLLGLKLDGEGWPENVKVLYIG